MTTSPSDASSSAARPPTRPARRHVIRRALWIGLAIFCAISITATQMIDRYAPGNPFEAQVMSTELQQRLGQGSILRLEASMRDRLRAIWSNELPATATVYVSGEPADPANQAIYACLYVRQGDSWRLTETKLVVVASASMP